MADFDPETAGIPAGTAPAPAPDFDPERAGVAATPLVPTPPPVAPHDDPDLKAAWDNAKSPVDRLKVMLGFSDRRGLDTYKQNAKEALNPVKSIALNGGGAALGQAIGAAGGPFAPLTVPAGGFIGGTLGNLADQATSPGDKPIQWGQALSNGVAGLIPGESLVNAGAKQIAKAGAKYAVGNLAAKTVETEIDQGRKPTLGEALIASGSGAIAAPLSVLIDPGSKVAQIEADKIQNSIRDETLSKARNAGYAIPSSTVNASSANSALESLAGKAALKQEATLKNQMVTNDLAKKPFAAWGLPQDEPITKEALDDVRDRAGQIYERMTGLFPDAGPMVYDLKSTRLQAKYEYNKFHFGNPPGDPQALFNAQTEEAKADQIEQQLETVAHSAGQPQLVDQLRAARKVIAQTYTVEKALNPANGDVSARIIGSSYKQGKPLTDGLDTIGRFYNGFKQFAGDAAATPSPGVGKTKAFASMLLGEAGGTHGGPAGMMLGAALPFADKVPRSLALSSAYQNSRLGQPFYGNARPDLQAILARFMAQNAGRQAPAPALNQFQGQSQ